MIGSLVLAPLELLVRIWITNGSLMEAQSEQ